MFDSLSIVISRQEIESKDISVPLNSLKQLILSPTIARSYQEKVVIAVDGYNDISWELFEIPEVREYIYKLDEKFPFWLFFLSKSSSSLQFILLCFLPPFLTDEGKAEVFPGRISSLLSNRLFPAMNQVAEFAGLSEIEIEKLTDRAIEYVTRGISP